MLPKAFLRNCWAMLISSVFLSYELTVIAMGRHASRSKHIITHRAPCKAPEIKARLVSVIVLSSHVLKGGEVIPPSENNTLFGNELVIKAWLVSMIALFTMISCHIECILTWGVAKSVTTAISVRDMREAIKLLPWSTRGIANVAPLELEHFGYVQ